jgi:hypothetical protein
MLNPNIRDVQFIFEAGEQVELALNETSDYLPCEVSRLLREFYSFALPETRDRDIALSVAFHAAKRDEMVFTALDHAAKAPLAEFRLPFAGAVGRRDWQYYLDNKEDGMRVSNPVDGAVRNFHDVLAKKLQGALQQRGLMHVYTGAANVDSIPDIRIERQLIGIAVVHREMHAKPETIARRLENI